MEGQNVKDNWRLIYEPVCFKNKKNNTRVIQVDISEISEITKT